MALIAENHHLCINSNSFYAIPTSGAGGGRIVAAGGTVEALGISSKLTSLRLILKQGSLIRWQGATVV